jgi:hypothetical protein
MHTLTHPLAQQCPSIEGADCPRQQHHLQGNFVGFNCENGENQYSDLATLFFNTQVGPHGKCLLATHVVGFLTLEESIKLPTMH